MNTIPFAFAGALLALAACSAPPYPAYAIEDDAEEVAHVVVSDALLQDIVRVGRPLIERLHQSELLRVVVPIRNIDDEPINILAQMSFQNAQRVPIGDDTNSQAKIIPAGSTVNFDVTSRSTEAADYILRLSWNKRP